VQFSPVRTLGTWLAAFFTLAILSFLYRDNVFYRVAESIFVGVSAAYWMVFNFWSTLVPNLLAKLFPALTREWFIPGMDQDARVEFIYLVPLFLSVMLLSRLAPGGEWLARWPLAFVVGTTAGLKLIGFLHSDVVQQVNNTIVPLVVVGQNGGLDILRSVKNSLMVAGVLAGLVYFLFSAEHKGAVGRVARLGIWVMMITFGAAFAYTVMGRIALIVERVEFLLNDWLWLIDPAQERIGL
jgi:hypothetical protein